jgi:hypothetical protein
MGAARRELPAGRERRPHGAVAVQPTLAPPPPSPPPFDNSAREPGRQLPQLISRGLAAHDELKYYLRLLHTAGAHAQAPQLSPLSMRAEREAAGVSDASLDGVVAASHPVGPGTVRIPGATVVLGRVFDSAGQMLEAVRTAAVVRPDLRDRAERYRTRLDELLAHVGTWRDDELSTSALVAMTKRAEQGGDSVYQLAADLRWELERLLSNVVRESIDGAETYGLTDADRVLVRAFMRGIGETAVLRFDHSGFQTRATRDDDHLSIHNDLGIAQVSVRVNETSRSATVHYADRLPQRVRFFRELLRPFTMAWELAHVNGADESSIGRYAAPDQEELEAFLAHVGSRLVFLLDWNRARRRLSQLVTDVDALALLRWAADNNIGHRGFLQAGGIRLIRAALDRAAPSRVRSSGRLDDLLGRDAARLFLTAVLRIASSGIHNGGSLEHINDEVESELLLYARRSERMTLGAVVEHATVVAAAVEWVGGTVERLKNREAAPERDVALALMDTWRQRADEQMRRTLRLIDRANELPHLRSLLANGNRAVRAVERTVFTLTLVPAGIDPALMTLLDSLCDLVRHGAREYVRLLEEARDLARSPSRADVERLVVAVDRLVALDDHCDAAGRTVLEGLIRGAADFRALHLLSAIAGQLDAAFDAFVRSSLIVRDHVLSLGTHA